MRDVVIDTNVLLAPFTEGLRLMDELERLIGLSRPVMAAPVITELKSLAQGNDAPARAASGALRMARAWAVEETDLPGDDGVLDVARRLQATVVSNDKKVQQEAQKAGLKVIGGRGKGRLMLLGA